MVQTVIDIVLSVFVVFGVYAVFVGTVRELFSDFGDKFSVAVFDKPSEDLEANLYLAKKYYGLRTVIVIDDMSRAEEVRKVHPNARVLFAKEIE